MGLPSKARLLTNALRVVETMSQEPDHLYFTKTNGRKIIVSRRVFSPKYFADSAFFASKLPRIVGKRSFLEIGIGTGVVALEVRLGGGMRVTGTDINPIAVVNAKMNFRRYGVRISSREGDMFEPLKNDERFDVIFWNHAYHSEIVEITDVLQRSILDPRYASLKKYFRGARDHLAPGGQLLLGTSNIARIRDIWNLGERYGFDRTLLECKVVPFAHRRNQRVNLRIYSFTPRINQV